MRIKTYRGLDLIYVPRSNQILPSNEESISFSKYGLKKVTLPYDFEFLKQQSQEHISYLILGCTQECNMRCSYCVHNGAYPGIRSHSSKQMAYETGIAAITWLHRHSEKSTHVIIGFYGGEPLLEFEKIQRWCAFAEKKFANQNLSFSISTNGILLNTNVVTWAQKHRNVHFNITMNGTEEIHDQRRRLFNGEKTYHTVFENIKHLQKTYAKKYDEKVLVFANYADFKEKSQLQKWLDNNPSFKSSCYLMPIVFPTERNPTDIANDQHALRHARMQFVDALDQHTELPQLLVQQRDFLKFIHKRPITRSNATIHPGICTPFLSRIFVNSDGNFFLCERTEDFLSLGDVYSGINWNAVKKHLCDDLSSFLNEGLKCHLCPAVRMCRNCGSAFLTQAGVENNPNRLKKLCSQMQSLLSSDLEFYCSVMTQNPKLGNYF